MSSTGNRSGPSVPSTKAPTTGGQSTTPGSTLTGELGAQFDAAQKSASQIKDGKTSWPPGHSMAPDGTKNQSGGYGSKNSLQGALSQLEGGGEGA